MRGLGKAQHSPPSASQDDPPGDAADVEHLVTSNQEDRKIGRLLTLLEVLNQPPNRDAGIDQDVEQSQSYSPDPTEDQAQKHAMDATMDPRGRMPESKFVEGHPFILEQPIRGQVKHEGRFEGG